MLHKNAMTDLAGALEKSLGAGPLNVKHHGPLPMLDLALGEVLGFPFQQAYIPSRWKCPAGSA